MTRNHARSVALEKVLVGNNRRYIPEYTIPHLGWGKMFVMVMLLGVMVVTGCLFAWSHLQVITQNYQISQLYKEQKELEDWNRKLRVELASLKSLGRLEHLAVEKYNMAPPAPHQVINLR